MKVRNWGINKYNDPIKEKRININIPMLGMILTNSIVQHHRQVKQSKTIVLHYVSLQTRSLF